jgi:hypothetical protein
MVAAAAGAFSALSFIFTSPLIAAVILIEATGLGGPKLRVVRIPGLLAGDRNARLDRNGALHRTQHQRLRARPPLAVHRPPS